jgi:aspartyl-tRNA(Asn)/glutamyl-tRNA(Gln) amidotransferase subunit C
MDTPTVKKIAHLARLQIDDAQLDHYAQDIGNILELMNQFENVNTDNITPMAHPLDLTQRLRDDTVTETNHREAYLKLAPAKEAGLYLVPQVIETEK